MYALTIRKYLEEHGFETLCPRAVLFDMDGVLYDSMPNHAIAWQESMARFHIHMTAEDAYATEGARGVDTIRMMVRIQQQREIDEPEAQKMYDEKSRLFHSLPEAPIMPGILNLMAQIRDLGMQCGVVTGSGQRPLIKRILKDFGAFVDEAHITTAYDVRRGKPNPDPYLVGVAARIFTIGVNTGPLPNDQLLQSGAHLLFPSMTDLSDAWKHLDFNQLL